jgi:hypothetical protein
MENKTRRNTCWARLGGLGELGRLNDFSIRISLLYSLSLPHSAVKFKRIRHEKAILSQQPRCVDCEATANLPRQ